MKNHYSMLIRWSDEDRVYVVSLPEFGGCMTHGATYEEAAKHGKEAIESLIDAYHAEGWPLPGPATFSGPEKTQQEIQRKPPKARKTRKRSLRVG